MIRSSRVVSVIALALASFGVVAVAHADQDIVRHRTVLPIDGRVLDVASVADSSADPIRIRLSGTMSSTLDGSEIDAFARRTNGTRWESDGPFVRLGSTARVVSRDEAAHTYVVEIPRSGDTTVALLVAPFASRHLVTLSEAQRSLSGAIELAVIDPAPTATESAVASVEDRVSEVPWLVYPGAVAGLGILGALGLVLTRKRRRPEMLLERRVREALIRLEKEAAGAGPAFEEVVGTCRRLAGKSGELRKHVEELDRAIDRTSWAKGSPGAEAQRESLRKERTADLKQLRTMAERIEETAAALAAHRAGRNGAKGIDDLLGTLRHDLETAVSAEDEARAI